MEDFHEYEGLFSTWMNLLTPDELKQIKLKKYELQVNYNNIWHTVTLDHLFLTSLEFLE